MKAEKIFQLVLILILIKISLGFIYWMVKSIVSISIVMGVIYGLYRLISGDPKTQEYKA